MVCKKSSKLKMEGLMFFQADSLRKQLYDYIKQELNSGTLKPGDLINQKQLSQDLGISRTPFRDCMIQLESEGIVTIVPCKGVYVRERTFQEYLEIHEIGRALESVALESAFYHIQANKYSELKNIVDIVLADLDVGLTEKCRDMNYSFHTIMINECPNKQLVHKVLHMRDMILDFPRRDTLQILKWEKIYWNEHLKMVEIIKNGTPKQLNDYSRYIHWAVVDKEEYFDHLFKVPAGTTQEYLEKRRNKQISEDLSVY